MLKNLLTLVVTLFSVSAFARPDILIYNGNSNPAVPFASKGAKQYKNGKRWGVLPFVPKEAKNAYRTLSQTVDFYQNNFKRNSYDGKGAPVEATINVQKFSLVDFMGLKENAAWIGQLKLFIFGGGGDMLDDFANSLDVIAHEFTHAVIDSTSQLKYEGQSGALNEHFADVFGEMAQFMAGEVKAGENLLLGENVITPELKKLVLEKQKRHVVALRDMLNPANGLNRQPAIMGQIPNAYGPSCVPSRDNDHCGVHILSGIPNRAVALMVTQLGWEKPKNLLYTVMTKRMTPTSKFADYAYALRTECQTALTAQECLVVDSSLRAVGL